MDKRDNGFQSTGASAKKAIQRVKADPDNSGRSERAADRPDGETRRLARVAPQDMKRSANAPSKKQPSSEQGRTQAQRPVPSGEGQKPRRRPNPDSAARPENRAKQDGRLKPESRKYIPLEDADGSRYSEIRINKKMRTWNKYKNYVFGAVGIIILVLIVTFSVRSCAREQKQEEELLYSKPSMGPLQVTESADQSQTQAATQPVEATTQAPTKPAGAVLTTTRTVASEEFTSEASFENSIFIGDSIVSGISYYKYLGNDRVVADTNLTASKALDKVSQIAAGNPDKVYIMLGLNDLNYNSKTVDSIAQDFTNLIAQIKQTVPTAKIYLVSVTPITKACESKSNIYIKMSNVEALNTKLKEVSSSQGVYFADINSALQDSSGYLNSSVTGNGYNLKSEYYGFLLNTLAEMTK
ncbi:MAG: GDSL-type esterase/lipase family protein [Bacteroides sp.]